MLSYHHKLFPKNQQLEKMATPTINYMMKLHPRWLSNYMQNMKFTPNSFGGTNLAKSIFIYHLEIIFFTDMVFAESLRQLWWMIENRKKHTCWRTSFLTGLKVSSLACRCVFYRPEHNTIYDNKIKNNKRIIIK